MSAQACRLTKRTFRVALSWTADGHQHERVVTCEARVCTSMIAASAVINLGDCSLGVQKTSSLDVQNLSDLPALVNLEFESKVITFRKTQKANIPPRQVTKAPSTSFASLSMFLCRNTPSA